MNVTLMRHGEAKGKTELTRRHTDLGREQCAATAAQLIDKRFDLVITSTYARALEAAAYVLSALGHRLGFRFVGISELGDLEEDEERIEEIYEANPDKGIEPFLGNDGEALQRYTLRAGAALFTTINWASDRTVLIVAHDVLIPSLSYFLPRFFRSPNSTGHAFLAVLESNKEKFLRLAMPPASGFRVSTEEQTITFFGGCG